ncbi:DinB family protein [Flavisolibacter sp. BT320]|nr:DinB family protein [Flavisolibacter longurius]
MKQEIEQYKNQLKETWEGDPWFGRAGRLLLGEVDEKMAFIKLNGQHSILQLVWHMYTWKAFAVNRLQANAPENLDYFESQDWRELDHSNKALWQEGLQKLEEAQTALLGVLQQLDDAALEQNVRERDYNNRKLINGVIQHDIYHLGQIAYIAKQIRNKA